MLPSRFSNAAVEVVAVNSDTRLTVKKPFHQKIVDELRFPESSSTYKASLALR